MTTHRPRCIGARHAQRKHQRGIAAIEFALVFTLLFLALYGIVTFGAVLYTQQVVARSAEDGARAVLRLGKTVAMNDPRVQEAIYDALASSLITPASVGVGVDQKKDWLRSKMVAPEINTSSPDQITIKVTYPYSKNPVLPNIVPWTSSWMPTNLLGKATAARPAV